MTEATAARAAFDLGATIRLAAACLKPDLLVTLPVAVVVVGGSTAGATWLTLHHWLGTTPLATVAGSFLVSLPQSIVLTLFEAWVSWLVFQRASGLTPDPWAVAARCLLRALPLAAMALLATFGMLAALVVFVVPGVILAIAWEVATPAAVAENLGPTKALSRSMVLTRGYRGPIFALVLIYYVVFAILSLLLRGSLTGFGEGWSGLQVEGGIPILAYAATPLLNSVMNLIRTAGVGAIYYALVVAKQGGAHAALAEVFA